MPDLSELLKKRIIEEGAAPEEFAPSMGSGTAETEADVLRKQLVAAGGPQRSNRDALMAYLEKVAAQSDVAQESAQARQADAMRMASQKDAMRSAGDLAMAAGQAFSRNAPGAAQFAAVSRETPEQQRAMQSGEQFQKWLAKRYDPEAAAAKFAQASGQDAAMDQNRRIALAQALEDLRNREQSTRTLGLKTAETEAERAFREAQLAQREKESRREYSLGKKRLDVDEAYKSELLGVRKSAVDARGGVLDDKAAKAASEVEIADPNWSAGFVRPDGKLVMPTKDDAKLARRTLDVTNMLVGNLSRIKELVDQYGPSVVARPEIRAEIQQLAADMQLRAKGPEMYGLGVLAGPDVDFLNRSLGDPLKIDFEMLAGSKGDKLRAAIGSAKRNYKSKLSSLGYSEAKQEQQPAADGEAGLVEVIDVATGAKMMLSPAAAEVLRKKGKVK